MADPETIFLRANDGIPNSPLPVLLYRDTELTDPSTAERTFAARDWLGAWRDGIFDFHHFHSTAHEVLAVVCGEVTVLLGGPSPGGRKVTATRGDVLVLPAGTGHCRLRASDELAVVGAYPGGMEWDVCRGNAAERDEVSRNLVRVPVPSTDPLHGADGPLPRLWAAGSIRTGA
jgi:uncharacterized protein YjlB